VDGAHEVTEGGPQRLWRAVENADQLWNRLDRPGWDRFGLTVTPDTNTLWYDHSEGEHRWTCSTPTPQVGYWTKAGPEQSR
jgi:hypothetical protein